MKKLSTPGDQGRTHLAPSDLGGQEGVAHDADAQVKRLDFSLRDAERDSTDQIARGTKRMPCVKWGSGKQDA